MCGFVGIINQKSNSVYDLRSELIAMTQSISHRGPDGQGFYINEEEGIYFGHRRLSIIDLSENGSQPMTSKCGGYILIFNGEIYNYQKIKNKFSKNFPWSSNTDTEVLLEALVNFGVEETLSQLEGQFSFGLYNLKDKELIIARDISGEKPLFYSQLNDFFIFGSELKSLYCSKILPNKLNYQSVANFLKYSFYILRINSWINYMHIVKI